MEGYTLLGIKLAMGIIGLVLQINLMGKGNLAPTSAMDQVQNYVLGGIIGGVIYSDSIGVLQFSLVLVLWTLLIFTLRFIKNHNQFVKSIIDGKPVSVILNGKVRLGNRVKIGAGCVLTNCDIGDDVEIKPYSVLEDASVGANAAIGPFSRLRPGADLAENTHVGNFVEIKKAYIGKGSKVNHLTYVGDAEIGKDCNIGAGVITCNYDGANKFKTTIGDNVFVGSDSQLVAPVTIESGATIGAGSTIRYDVKRDELVTTRVPQKHVQGWERPTKKK